MHWASLKDINMPFITSAALMAAACSVADADGHDGYASQPILSSMTPLPYRYNGDADIAAKILRYTQVIPSHYTTMAYRLPHDANF